MGILSNFKSPIFSEALVKINGKISKVGVVEVDVDWSPFKKSHLHLDGEKSSDDGDDVSGSEFSNDEDGISDTVAMDMTSESPEEGEILQDDDTDIVADSCAPAVNVAAVDGDDAQATFVIPGQNVDLNSHDLRINDNGGLQKEPDGSIAHVDTNRDFSLDKDSGDQENTSAPINVMSPIAKEVNVSSPEVQLGPCPFGPLEKLAKSGCFGPFLANNSLGPVGNSPVIDGLNFSIGGSVGKRRRIIHPEKIPPINFEESPFETQPISHSLSPTLDLNENPIPSTIPLPDSDTDSLSSSLEVRKTAMAIRNWRLAVFPKEKSELKIIQERMIAIEVIAESRPLTDSEVTERIEGSKRIEELPKHKDCYLLYILIENPKSTSMVFTRTCEATRFLASMLRNLGLRAIPISGQMTQAKRLGALNKFKSGECNILICTDVASRGLDIPSVDMVINYDIPTNSKDYIHRVGRTARAGRSGVGISLVNQYELEWYIQIEKLIGKKLPQFEAQEEEVLLLLERVIEAKQLSQMKINESRGHKRRRGGEEEDEVDKFYGKNKSKSKRL
ncbi:hypothetical protein L2E82_42625 [Cichorium intybus]|uniref:Uncharacterized protein n=1 Tax=Cichorium intybus TaxID=13427 RepID=A0ACB8ZLD2_CICIN|nr:hypothetical protein L2E82_42625 [Cichorium intybus]